MRIYDPGLAAGAQASQTASLGESQKVERDSQSGTGNTTGGATAGTDSVEFSSTLGRLSNALAAHGSAHSSRVEYLTAQYQSGNYRPNSYLTSRGIVSEALGEARNQ
jgi:hypothetical protein